MSGFPRRTSKSKILWRISIVPLGVIAFWTYMLSLGGDGEVVQWALIGGLGTLAALLGFLWGFVNFDDDFDDAPSVVANQKRWGRSLVRFVALRRLMMIRPTFAIRNYFERN